MRYANQPNVIVLGLPRGGVPVAFEVAKALHAPLDVFVVRKLGTPGRRELAMGAIGHRRQCAGPRWRPVGAQRVEGPLSPAGAGVGGWSIRRSTCRMGGEDGSVCARYRLQAKGTDWLLRFAMALDRGANLRMAGQLPSPRSGLRDQSTHERGLDQNRHDPPYGAKARLSILRQVLRETDKKLHGRDGYLVSELI